MNAEQRQRALTLELLQAVEQQNDFTQRNLAARMGVALGLANAYLKRCVRKGLVKVQQAPANRYLYYLTPKGFTEKSRLTAEYLRHSFDFYRKASASMSDVLRDCTAAGHRNVCLVGASELAEITLVRAREYPVILAALFDPAPGPDTFCGLPVFRDAAALGRFDACVVTAIGNARELRDLACTVMVPGRVLVPRMLGLEGGSRK